MKEKLLYYKNLISQTLHKYPHIFLLGAFIILTFIVSVANDAYFGSLFNQTTPNITQPTVTKPVYMKILEVTPETGIKQSYDTFMQFTVLFSDNIDPASIKITASPEQPLGYEVTGNKLRVFPKANWEFDLGYEITVDAKSTSGLVLEKPYVYSMYIALPADGTVFEVY
jgi:hypothetical protein